MWGFWLGRCSIHEIQNYSIVKLIKVQYKKPIDGEYYLVHCPKFCISEYAIALWDDTEQRWETEEGSEVNKFVESYHSIPLSEIH